MTPYEKGRLDERQKIREMIEKLRRPVIRRSGGGSTRWTNDGWNGALDAMLSELE